MTHYEVTIKEVGKPEPIITSYVGDVDKAYIVEFFGLNEPDVEWYEIHTIK